MLKIVSTLYRLWFFLTRVCSAGRRAGKSKNLSEMKQKVLSHMDKAIAEMQNGKSCVSAATTRSTEDMSRKSPKSNA